MDYNATTKANDFEGLPINTGDGKYESYTCILQTIKELLEQMIIKHSKVLFIRFDVHYPQDYWDNDPSNAKISLLFKKINNYFGHHKIACEYIWVREQSRQKHKHYHCVLLIDGNERWQYVPILKDVERKWGQVLHCENPKGLICYCNKRDEVFVENGIMIERPSRLAKAYTLVKQNVAFTRNIEKIMEWSSYLAKVNQKNKTPDGYRKFNASKFDRPLDRLWSGMELNGRLFNNLKARDYYAHIHKL